MKISYNWLKELVDLPWDPKELAERLTMVGLAVESVEPQYPELNGVVIGRIERVERHPKTNELYVCDVNIGTERLSIVSGAPNTISGIRVPVAPPGAILPGGLAIKPVNIKGEESTGMICSEKELGLSDDHSGLMILEKNIDIGKSLVEALNLTDFILTVDITPNRGDCLSMIGIAREVAALTGNRLRRPKIEIRESLKQITDYLTITIEDPQSCPRYAARIIDNLVIDRSPWWLRQKVEACGMRSINNVVDITNLVMLECGHPLHAFDYELFSQKQVVVRRGRAKEKFKTLDGVERALDNQLLITDGPTPVGIAGIIGGEKSQITATTHKVLIESAYFDPVTIRLGRKKLGIQTDASSRFERGADPNNVIYAINRAAQLLGTIASGEIYADIIDVYPKPMAPLKITLRPARVNQILGTEIPTPQMATILANLECSIVMGKEIQVTVPTFRPDLTREVDLIEEIGRIWGYEKIPVTTEVRGAVYVPGNHQERLTREIKRYFVSQGYYEVVTNTLVDPECLNKMDLPELPILVRNPISPELSGLRTSLLYSLLKIVQYNQFRQIDEIRLFEIGRIFLPGDTGQPEESLKLAVICSGGHQQKRWDTPPRSVDLYDLKGVFDGLTESFGWSEFNLKPYQTPYFAAGWSYKVTANLASVGVLGKVSSPIQKMFDLTKEIFYCELDYATILRSNRKPKQYVALPKYPFVERDIAVVVNQKLPAIELLNSIKSVGRPLLTSVWLFDLYTGKPLPAGKKNLAFRLRYQSLERTLTDKEVDEVQGRIISVLKKEFDAEHRNY